MTAFAGVVDARAPPSLAPLATAMMHAMSHRIGGGSGVWAGEGATLGSGAPRWTSAAAAGPRILGPLTLAGDVRLDNRDDLAAGLEATGDDADLLLAAYARWGDGCAERLLGDFAFAVWDARARRLFCARDSLGVRPFYYARDGGRLIFASETRGVRAALSRPARADEERIADFLAGLPPPVEASFYAEIARLPAGCALVFQNGEAQVRSYWSLQPGEIRPRPDAAEEFRHLFFEAVGCRMRAAEAPGAFLSGGLDSSSIACVAGDLAHRAGGPPLPVISLVFDQAARWSERPQIETVVARGGLSPTFVAPTSPFAEFDELLVEQDGLAYAPSLGTTRRTRRAVAELGLDVVLDGHGGDEVVSHGTGRLTELATARRWAPLWREIGGLTRLYGESRPRMFGRFMWNYGRGAHLRRRLMARLRRGRRPEPAAAAPDLLAPALRARTTLTERQAQRRPSGLDEQSEHLQVLAPDMQSYALEILDRTTAIWGVEARYPFLDRRLVEFCLNLEAREKLDGGWSRLVLRRAMEGVLPPAIQWRADKLDFTPHVVLGMLGPDRALLEHVIADDALDIGEHVALPVLRAAYARMQTYRQRASGYDVQLVWRGVAFALWLRKARADGLAIA